VAATRTAGGRKGGKLAGWHPIDLAAAVLDGVLDRTGLDPAAVDDVVMGCVGQVGEQSLNVARNAVLASRMPESVPATSVDRQCGSSQQALQFAAQAIMSGTQDIVIAAGVESMSRVPMGLSVALPAQNGFGNPMSPAQQKRYPNIQFSQFMGAEMVAERHQLTKDEIDAWAYRSHQHAIAATQAGAFRDEITVLKVKDAEGAESEHTVDEGIRFDASLDAIKGVKLLREGGRITAASSSQICDGASAVMVVSEKALKEHGLTPLARIHHLSVYGGDPVVMLETPIPSTLAALKKAGMSVNDIDLFEVNEAFGSVPVAWLKVTGADPEKLNANGGAIALGHPLGASGTKLMATLIYGLKARGKKWGLQTMCEGGGLANVTIVETL
jgi:acetyl-CoA C-acetyltransferase